MSPTLGPMSTRKAFKIILGVIGAALAAASLGGGGAHAENAYCTDLRGQIAKAGSESLAVRYRSAAAKQRQEYGRLAARARSMGCDREQFLFFGDPPPPQCGPLNARMAGLQSTIAAYDRGGADDSQRQALMARYETDCRNPGSIPSREEQPHSFFQELFGVEPPDRGEALREVPVGPGDGDPRDDEQTGEQRPQGGPMAICVRSCDGGFFPITYTARNSSLDDLDTLCKAMCPGVEAKLYTQSQWKGLELAVSVEGEPYADHPNAFKYQKTYDASCGCKPQGQSWVEALAEAERILAERNKKDQMVTAEQAEQMSRPIGPADPRSRKQDGQAAGGSPAQDRADALRGSVGSVTTGREVFREVVGPDGVKRRVRVVAPTL